MSGGGARRVALLRERWERTEDVAWLTQARNLLERATPRAPNTPGQALAASSLCELSSAIVFDRPGTKEYARSVADCERAMALQGSSRSVEPTVRHQYAIALVRHGHAARNVETLRRGVAQLAEDAADHDRSVRHRSTMASNYAWGLWLLATLENPGEHLRNASAAIENAAWPGAREAAPVRWAQIRKLAGKVYLARGSLERAGFHMKPAAEYYRQAQQAFLDAQTVFTKREAASPWARLEERIGDALAQLGEIEGSGALYMQSVQHYHRALSIQQQSVDPEAFARIQLGIGRAHLDWADQQRGLDRIRRTANQAVSAFRLALDAYRKLGVAKKIADTEEHLALAVAIVARVNRSRGCEALALTLHAIETDPTASGPDESARASVARSDPANYGPTVCPSLDRDAWMKIRASAGQ